MTRIKKSTVRCSLFPVLLTIVLAAGVRSGQVEKQQETEIDIKILSAEITRFKKPIRIGPGKRAIEYQEALVLKGEVSQQEFDALPPDIEPFLYIGRHEFRIFDIDRKEGRKELILTFHVRDWEELKEGEPIVLTIDHGAPVRDPRRFVRRDIPKFRKARVVDKRPDR